jgi:hypothetical protein
MVSQDEFCDLVLDFISDDYEAPSTITADISRWLARDVTEGEVLEALLALVCAGLAQAYVCDPDTHRYVPVEEVDDHPESLWFMARP